MTLDLKLFGPESLVTVKFTLPPCPVNVPTLLAIEGVLVYYEKEEVLGPLTLESCPVSQFLLEDYHHLILYWD